MHWYVVRTKPHQERKVEFRLRQLSVETFLPMLRQHKKIRRQHKSVVEPLFPRYLFARFNMNDRYRAVNFASGVLNIVEFGSKPAEVSESLIDTIRARSKDGYVTPETEVFQNGQIVQIKDGPLAGIQAVFMRNLAAQHRVLLLLNTIGLHAKLTVGIEQIYTPRASNV
jgi:transcriptional antiterminator RfaH